MQQIGLATEYLKEGEIGKYLTYIHIWSSISASGRSKILITYTSF